MEATSCSGVHGWKLCIFEPTHPPSLSDTALILSRHILELERHRSRLFWSYPHTSGAAGSKNPTAPSTWQGRLLHVLLRFVYAEGPCRCCLPAVLTKQLLCSWHQRRLESCRCSQGMTTWMVIPLGEFDCLCYNRSVGRNYPPSEVSSWLVGGKLVRGMNHLDHLYNCILNNRIDDNI